MGLTLSSPGVGYDSFDQSLDALLKSLSLSNDYIKSSLRSMSFNGRDSEPVLKAWGSGKNLIKKSLSFNKRDKDPLPVEPKLSTKIPNLKEKPEKEKMGSSKNTRFAPVSGKVREPGSPKHKAAVKLQKVYKSFRTRRQLADCAVLVEQRWWKLLDFAMLKRSSVSFFNDEKTESTLSKWSRAKSRAAKVGKGLSKDEKARKLALQHWLEAIDPRHRYGHNLHFYYDRWLRCESKQPFFYWLDVGEGKEVSLDEKCPRSKLQQQCIKYLGPKEREAYEVIVEDGKLLYKKSEQVLDTTEESKDSKWIFVLSTSKNLYVGQKKKGTFQHSSFLAGGATSAAGRLEVKNGILEAIWPHSGHYRPTEENFQEFVTYLKSRNVDLTDVKKSPLEEDEETCSKLKSVPSDLSSSRRKTDESEEHESIASKNPDTSEDSFEKSDKHERASNINMMNNDSEESEEEEETHVKTNDIDSNSNLFVEGQEKAKMPSELILRRMKFRKETLPLQLGKQLSCKWTTGAGPRIGCVRDSPSELRFRALEEVNLSPRSDGANPRAWSASRNLPSPLNKAQGTSSSSSKEIERGKSDDR